MPTSRSRASATSTKVEQLGYDVTIFDAGGYGNLSRQVSQIEDVIERGVAAIVLVPASSEGTVPAVERAVAAGIPVINDGIATQSDMVTGFVGEDSYVMAELLAAYLVNETGGEADIAMLLGPAGLDLTLFRQNGFMDYIAKYPGMNIVAEKFTGTASFEALNAMQDFLQANPGIDAVYTFNGPIAIGAVQALRAAGSSLATYSSSRPTSKSKRTASCVTAGSRRRPSASP
ncbi:MAG: sugar ABC transporter substrate-binding protein [Trueperaceae bacterium]|nr:sugar ABC transporter substrate-binding protein [Trueperaceae bacterium]